MATLGPSALPHQVLSLCLLQQARRRPMGAPATAMGLPTWHLLRLSPSRLGRPTVMSGLRTRRLLWLSPSRLGRPTVMSGLRTRQLLWLSPSRLGRPTGISGLRTGHLLWLSPSRLGRSTAISGLRTWHLLWLSPLRLGRSAASIVTGAMAFASIDEATEDSDGESWARPAASRLSAGASDSHGRQDRRTGAPVTTDPRRRAAGLCRARAAAAIATRLGARIHWAAPRREPAWPHPDAVRV
jgi:hypothetical protein